MIADTLKNRLLRARHRLRSLLGLAKRIYIRTRYRGLRYMLRRAIDPVVRRTPLQRLVAARAREVDDVKAIEWYAKHAQPVTVVIPTYGAAEFTRAAVESIHATVSNDMVRVIVVDDCGPEEERAALQAIPGAEVVIGEQNLGFAGNVNRGLAMAAEGDVVILNNDVIAHAGWIEALQTAAYKKDNIGIVGPMLLYPDGRIQWAGTIRNPGAPEWFDHRFRFQPATHGPANVALPVLAATGACMYVKRAVLDAIGVLDERFPMAFEDVDYSIRAWEAGFRVQYCPTARLTHHESATRGTELGERERKSMDWFWEKWGEWFDNRNVRTADGKLRVIYVTEDTGVGGGHRDIFEHLNNLQRRGHEVALFTLREEPGWFPLEAPVRVFKDYAALTAALAEEEAIKVATWWNTAEKVWTASVCKGIPAFLVQDIETSYYDNHHQAVQSHVLASYRPEMRTMTISERSRNALAELGIEATLVPPGIDLETFRPLNLERRNDVLLALGRSNPLKNLPLTIKAWKRLQPRPELWMFGVEPRIGVRYGAKYFTSPPDERVNELFNEVGVFVQTSRHEGFCLPVLEAMASGTPVVCTDMVGNRDFCEDGVNCVMVDHDPASVAAGIRKVLDDAGLREKFRVTGPETAARFAWPRRMDEVEAFFEKIAEPGPMATSSTAATETARARS